MEKETINNSLLSKFALIAVLIFAVIVVCVSCSNDGNEDIDFDNLSSSLIEGLTVGNYPRVDGSTSTEPLNTIIACKLFGIDYKWVTDFENLQRIQPSLNKKDTAKFNKLIKSSQTHQSFINLIDKETDLILVARKMSPDEKAHADAKGVSLVETPIALDALVFIVNPENPITSLTTAQIQNIYMSNITNWNEVGGPDAEITPYVRNANSGSQELMETLAMEDLDMADHLENYNELIVHSMTGAVDKVFYERNAICYTVYYFKEYMVKGVNVKSVAINGVYPNRENIGNNSYPYAAEVYAVIRSDLDKSSMAYKLYEWLQTAAGKQAINESGYVPSN